MKLDLKSPAVQRLLLSIILSGGILAVFFFTHYVPFSYPSQRDKITALKADFDKKSGELARAKATVADLPKFEAEYAQLHERWTMAAELLPEEKQIGALLRRITLAAQQTGVEFVVFRPEESRAEQHYTELPLHIAVHGGYHQVGSFVAELTNMRRIVTVSNLNMKAGATPTSTTSVEFTASAYSLNPGSRLDPVPATTTQQTTNEPKKGEGHAKKS